MIPLVLATIIGGLATASIAAPFGITWAIIAAPFVGSLCAILAGAYVARQLGREWHGHVELDQQADAMVASLRGITAQAKGTTKEDVKPPSRDQNEVTGGSARPVA